MSWFEVIQHNAEEKIDIVARSGFSNPLSPKEVADVVQILAEVLTGKVASKLFEGLSSFGLDSRKLDLGFNFSINPEHMARVEASIGRNELTDHRVTFVMFVFASVDLKHRLDTSLPQGFRQSLSLTEYIQ
ncbi:MAG: hypothetical protein K8L97_00775 [Anaerolineae bacterium]|nr:hypothetical protein [Anaerolineae bacterium]